MADYYCSNAATGGGVGSSADPWTLAEGNTAWGDGTIGNTDRLGLKNSGGIYTTGDLVWTVNGLARKKTLVGCTDAIGDDGLATIQRNAGAGVLLDFTSTLCTLENLIIDGQDGGTDNLKSLNGNHTLRNIRSHNAGNWGIYINVSDVINFYVHDNPGYGIVDGVTGSRLINGLGVNNGGIGIFSRRLILNCIGKGNVINIQGFGNAPVINSVSDGGTGDGIDLGTGSIALNCIIINSPAAKYGLKGGFKAVNCDFYNNIQDIDDATKKRDCYAVDPQFNNTAALDYTRTGTNLDDLGFSDIGMIAAADYNIDIGPDQGVGADYPAEADVEDGVDYDNGDKTGTFEAPAESDVRVGVGYGADGTEFEGDVELPAEAEVESGVGYGSGGTEFEGELVISRVESPISLAVQDDRITLEVENG